MKSTHWLCTLSVLAALLLGATSQDVQIGGKFCHQNEVDNMQGVTCPNSDKCLPLSSLCDGLDDCGDNSDEDAKTCILLPCVSKDFDHLLVRCEEDAFHCIQEAFLLDGQNDCVNGSDESIHWWYKAPRYCFNRYGSDNIGYNCPKDPSLCVMDEDFCDGTRDCDAAVDEDDDETPEVCEAVTCRNNHLKCPNIVTGNGVRCIHEDDACDGKEDCGDGADELIEFCEANGQDTDCGDDEIQCPNTEYFKCIDTSKACNHAIDCPGGEDENSEWCGTLEKKNMKSEAEKELLELERYLSELGRYKNINKHVQQESKQETRLEEKELRGLEKQRLEKERALAKKEAEEKGRDMLDLVLYETKAKLKAKTQDSQQEIEDLSTELRDEILEKQDELDNKLMRERKRHLPWWAWADGR